MPTYYAHIDANNVVTTVIVADQTFIESGVISDPKNWVQTWVEGGSRKNCAGIGHEYNKEIDAFVPPKPSPAWVLDTKEGTYQPPKGKEMPKGGKPQKWDNATQEWVEN